MHDFLGKPTCYWLDLEKYAAATDPTAPRLLEEIARLRGKVSFYESRITELHSFSNIKEGNRP